MVSKNQKKGCQRSRKKIMNGGCVNNASSSFNQQNIHHNSLNHRMPRKNIREMVGGCCVCADESGWAENPLVYCDGQGCNVAVHQGLLFFFYHNLAWKCSSLKFDEFFAEKKVNFYHFSRFSLRSLDFRKYRVVRRQKLNLFINFNKTIRIPSNWRGPKRN